MGIDQFLDSEEDSWAEMGTADDFLDNEPPTATTADSYNDGNYRQTGYGRGRGDRYDRGGDRGDRGGRGRDRYEDRGDRYSEKPRRVYEELPVPDKPPYVAHVGNLPFSATDDEVFELFAENVDVEAVRIIVDHATNRSKGFGYVTFKNRESLEDALGAHEIAQVGDRVITVRVAEGQKESRSQREPSRADTVDRWERGKNVPVKEREPRNRGFGGRADNDRGGRKFDNDRPRNERKPLNIQPRTNAAPVGGPSESKKNDPFGGAKPRDELAMQKQFEERQRQREEELKKREAERERPKRTNFKGRDSPKGSRDSPKGRDFSAARDNMGKKPVRTAGSKPAQQKKIKPQTVQTQKANIPVANAYAALANDA